MKAVDMYAQLPDDERGAIRKSLTRIALWGTGIAPASAGRVITRIPTMRIAPLILSGIAIPSIAYYRSPALKRVMRRVDPYRLTLAHAWRVVAGIAFLRWGASGRLPKIFTNRAGWGDIASGAVALALCARQRVVRPFPPAMCPLFGVGLTGAAHVVAFDLLRRVEDPR